MVDLRVCILDIYCKVSGCLKILELHITILTVLAASWSMSE